MLCHSSVMQSVGFFRRLFGWTASHGKVCFNELWFLNTRLGAGCFVLVKTMKSRLCSSSSRPMQSEPPTEIAAGIILPQWTPHSLTSLYTRTGYDYACVGFKITFGTALCCCFILIKKCVAFHTIFINRIRCTERGFLYVF